MSAQLHLLALLLCACASAAFSGMESGVLSLNHARLVHLVRAGSAVARLLSDYVADLQRFLAAILVGNNLVNVMLSTLSASFAQSAFPGSPLLQAAWGLLVASLMLVFCEYLPKLFFTTRPLRRTLLVVRAFRLVERALAPVTALVLFLTKWLVPGGHASTDKRFLMTREYIQNVVSDPKHGSRITAFERLMINRVLGLQSQTAQQIMTPISSVSRTLEGAPLSACFRLVRDSGHVRLPVFSEDGARCVGVLNALEALAAAPDPERALARDLMQPPFFVDQRLQADDVLPLLRKGRQPMALVRDAQGAVLGIITEQNVLSALTGSLR